jgi:hypothetical protein
MSDIGNNPEKTDFSLSGQTMDFLESETDFSALHDTRILFCIDVERLFVDGVVSFRLWLEHILGEEIREEI